MKFLTALLALTLSISAANAQKMAQNRDYAFPQYGSSAPIVVEKTIFDDKDVGNAASNLHTYYMLHTGLICVGHRATARGGVECAPYNVSDRSYRAFVNVCERWNRRFPRNQVNCPKIS